MPKTNIDQQVTRITRLAQAEVNLLNANGILNKEDLQYIGFKYFNIKILVVKRIKLDLICQYLTFREVLDLNMEMVAIKNMVQNSNNPNPKIQERAGNFGQQIQQISAAVEILLNHQSWYDHINFGGLVVSQQNLPMFQGTPSGVALIRSFFIDSLSSKTFSIFP